MQQAVAGALCGNPQASGPQLSSDKPDNLYDSLWLTLGSYYQYRHYQILKKAPEHPFFQEYSLTYQEESSIEDPELDELMRTHVGSLTTQKLKEALYQRLNTISTYEPDNSHHLTHK